MAEHIPVCVISVWFLQYRNVMEHNNMRGSRHRRSSKSIYQGERSFKPTATTLRHSSVQCLTDVARCGFLVPCTSAARKINTVWWLGSNDWRFANQMSNHCRNTWPRSPMASNSYIPNTCSDYSTSGELTVSTLAHVK